MRSSALAFLVALVFLQCDGTRPTPVGTTILDVASVDPPGLGSRRGPFATFDKTYAFRDRGPAIDAVGSPAFRLTFEHGPAAFSGDGSAGTKQAGALQNLRIVVARNERWAISARCDPPMLRADLDPSGNETSWIQCPVTIARQDGRVTFTSYVQITASPSVSTGEQVGWGVDVQ
ncbi:MAG TPA: hypothetical protein VMI75_22795 [Polyangiaceae bacterium]|nr:hypothetical protein [Polyangiaceae bacterium]